MMLRLIVTTAIHWIRVGLPLKLLKIVLFQRETEVINNENQKLVDHFEKLKEQWLQIETHRKLQVFLTFLLTLLVAKFAHKVAKMRKSNDYLSR